MEDIRSLLWIFGEKRADKVDKVTSIMSFDRLRVFVNDVKGKSFHACLSERMVKSRYIVEDAAKSPNINWIRIQLMLDDFRSKVNRSAYSRRNELILLMHYLAHPQIS